ncbi:MAG TPA: hypothetical protein VHT70_04045 [Candidatus Saccharimonadales bacterium]|jgi:hypothetical protein|nr:hypothetical protein [Candidatus Saccharimonadales bacterium]
MKKHFTELAAIRLMIAGGIIYALAFVLGCANVMYVYSKAGDSFNPSGATISVTTVHMLNAVLLGLGFVATILEALGVILLILRSNKKV